MTRPHRYGPRQPELRQAVYRLTLQFTALMMLLLALVGAMVYSIVAAGVAESQQQTLTDAARIEHAEDAPKGVFVAVLHAPEQDGDDDDAGGLAVSANMPAGLPDLDAMNRVAAGAGTLQNSVTLGDHTYTVRTARVDERVVQVAVDRHEGREELGRLLTALLLSGAVVVVLSALAAAWMARRAMRPMADALALQRRFVADASHELRTPLTLLSTRAQMLRRRIAGAGGGTAGAPLPDGAGNRPSGTPLWGEVSAGVDELVGDAKALTEILEDLLISADPREAEEPEPVDLAAEADSVVAAQQTEATRRGLALARAGASGPVTVTGHRTSLDRVLTALVSNALDHAGTRVQVEVATRGRHAVVRVSDDGPGFPEGQRDRAFERFASSRPRTEGQQRHYGLGLALVAEVVARHKGTVRVAPTAPGQGAVIEVVLPLA